MRKIAAPWGLTPDCKLKRNILVEVETDGVIRAVEWELNDLDSLPSVEYYNGILIPSLINSHCHLELSFLQGKIPKNSTEGLIGFFKNLSSLRNCFSDEDKIRSAEYQDLYMWREGVSAVGDISNSIYTLQLKSQSKIKYRTFAEYYGLGQNGNVDTYISRKVGGLLDSAKMLGLDITPAPHSTYLVPDQPFRYAGNMETVSVHFMESWTENDFFAGKGKMYDYVNTSYSGKLSELPYNSSSDRVIKSFPKDVRLLLVHCTQIGEDDVKKIVDYFDDVTFVLCPCSNMYIEGSMPPALMLYEMGCRIAIGTDSLSSNISLSMAKEIVKLCNCGVPLNVVLGWATIGGAHALGYINDFGTFETGKRSGVALVSGVDLNTLKVTNKFNIKRIV